MKRLLILLFLLISILIQMTVVSSAQGAVTLISFNAYPNLSSLKIKLFWETGSELNFAGFYIQRSLESNSNFTRLVDHYNQPIFIPAQGDGGAGAQYVFNDTGVDFGNIYYYRLEMVDLSGMSEFSDIVSASVTSYPVFLPMLQK